MFDALKTRSSQLEIMDDFHCDGEVVNQTLRELHSINTYLGGNQLSIKALERLIKKSTQSHFSLVDLGCGGGDTLKLFARWVAKKNISLDLVGVDANAYITEYAQNNCLNFPNISFQTENIFSPSFQSKKFDVAHASLFLHHFSEDEIIALFKQLYQQVAIGFVINDLHRHWISYYFTKYIITRWSKSDMVKFDSVVSVARSFTRNELTYYLHEAGITHYSLKWKWAYRWELVISK